MEPKDITPGQIVYSKAGRDKGRYYIVVGMPWNEYVLISDGDIRTVEKPKKKKIKHLVIHDLIASDIREKLENNNRITNSEIRNSLKLLGLFNQLNGKEV
ncbi:MAG: KOW domain-containing RNA-binding protein [Methanobacterium paludis]|nr:KOW domain-containing RNA-binding protein [Methanobacterium paludis]